MKILEKRNILKSNPLEKFQIYKLGHYKFFRKGNDINLENKFQKVTEGSGMPGFQIATFPHPGPMYFFEKQSLPVNLSTFIRNE